MFKYTLDFRLQIGLNDYTFTPLSKCLKRLFSREIGNLVFCSDFDLDFYFESRY